MKKYYILKDGKKIGPIQDQELLNADISDNTLVWCKGLTDWTKAGDIPSLRVYLEDIPPSIPKNLSKAAMESSPVKEHNPLSKKSSKKFLSSTNSNEIVKLGLKLLIIIFPIMFFINGGFHHIYNYVTHKSPDKSTVNQLQRNRNSPFSSFNTRPYSEYGVTVHSDMIGTEKLERRLAEAQLGQIGNAFGLSILFALPFIAIGSLIKLVKLSDSQS